MSKNQNPQENQAAEVIATTGSWLEANKKQVLTIVSAIVLVVGGFLAYTHLYQNPREEKAQTLFTEGLQYVQQGDSLSLSIAINGEGTFPGYAKIADEFSGTEGANLANLQAGACYAKLGKYAEAIPYLEAFTPGDDQSVSAMGLFALAQCYAGVNNIDKAISTFQDAAEQANNSALSPMCLLEAGKLLETQDKKVRTSSVVRFVGGGALSDVTCQILADVTGKTVETVDSPQNVGAVGAAVIMAVGLGIIDDVSHAKRLIPAKKTFIPNEKNKAVYDRNYEVYKTLYKNNKKAFAALNG